MRRGYLIFSVVLLVCSGGYSIYDFAQPPRTSMHGTGGAELGLLMYAIAFLALLNLPLAIYVALRRVTSP